VTVPLGELHGGSDPGQRPRRTARRNTNRQGETEGFDYADCGGTVPGFACTRDQAYCYVGWWCDYNYPVAVNPNVHDQGTEFCPALRSGTR
jgi:hypothetical protein